MSTTEAKFLKLDTLTTVKGVRYIYILRAPLPLVYIYIDHAIFQIIDPLSFLHLSSFPLKIWPQVYVNT